MTRRPPSRALRIQSIHIFWCVMSLHFGQYVNAGNPSDEAGATVAPLNDSMALISVLRTASPHRDCKGSPRVGPSCDSASAMPLARWSKRHTGSLGIWTAGMSEPTEGAPWNSLPPNAMLTSMRAGPPSPGARRSPRLTTTVPRGRQRAARRLLDAFDPQSEPSGHRAAVTQCATKKRPLLLKPSIVAVRPLITNDAIRVAGRERSLL